MVTRQGDYMHGVVVRISQATDSLGLACCYISTRTELVLGIH